MTMPAKTPSSLLLLLLLLLLAVTAQSDWTRCPQSCKCKWVSGRKAAECTNTSLTAVPANLSSEIQSLELSYNSIPQLPYEAFKAVNLVNLHKIFLKECGIQAVDMHALSGLEILIELDLSNNRIKVIHPDTFRDNKRLRILLLNRNPITTLEDGTFRNFEFLQTVEVSDCHITHIGSNLFENVPKMQHLKLNGNKLASMRLSTIRPLSKLMSLELHSNPWNCDCHLMEFFNWTISHNLWAHPTSCVEPPSLNNRPWNELKMDDFVCSPEITFPPAGTAIEADEGNVTLACQVLGNPMPDVQWVFHSRIIGNYSKRSHTDHRYVVTESRDGTKWVNLTVIQVREKDSGNYTCVAKSPGGMEERNVSLKVKGGIGGAFGTHGSMMDTWALIIGLVIGLIILLVTVISLTYCLCRRKRSRKEQHRAGKKVPNDGVTVNCGGGEMGFQQNCSGSEQEKSLITQVNPVQKPPRRYEMPAVNSAGTELTEMKCGLLDNGSVYAGGSVADSDDRLEDPSIDSLDSLPQKCSTTDSGDARRHPESRPPDLLSFPPRNSQVSPAGSTTSTAPDNSRLPAQHGPQSPVHSPVYQPGGGHMFGTLPYSRSQSPFSTGTPVVMQRQGYVTIPRRPRVPSWSSAPTPTPAGGDPLGFKLEPVYDNLGPRTTADGSSVLSLNKSFGSEQPTNMRGRPLPSIPSYQNNTLPAYYAPIEEQPSPKLTRGGTRGSLQRSTPNINVISPTATSSRPLLEATMRQRPGAPRVSPDGASLKNQASPPNKRNSAGAMLTNGGVKVPPKPPPKPKKKSVDQVTGPLFEDEGEDGTEV